MREPATDIESVEVVRRPNRENSKNATYTAGSLVANFGAAALITAITPTSSARGFVRFGISTLSFWKLVSSGKIRSSKNAFFAERRLNELEQSNCELTREWVVVPARLALAILRRSNWRMSSPERTARFWVSGSLPGCTVRTSNRSALILSRTVPGFRIGFI